MVIQCHYRKLLFDQDLLIRPKLPTFFWWGGSASLRKLYFEELRKLWICISLHLNPQATWAYILETHVPSSGHALNRAGDVSVQGMYPLEPHHPPCSGHPGPQNSLPSGPGPTKASVGLFPWETVAHLTEGVKRQLFPRGDGKMDGTQTWGPVHGALLSTTHRKPAHAGGIQVGRVVSWAAPLPAEGCCVGTGPPGRWPWPHKGHGTSWSDNGLLPQRGQVWKEWDGCRNIELLEIASLCPGIHSYQKKQTWWWVLCCEANELILPCLSRSTAQVGLLFRLRVSVLLTWASQ